MTPTDKYLERFKGEFWNQKDNRYAALQTALDLRKFEIDLYWKRAAYFWAFIALTFAGYFGAISSGRDKQLIAFTIAGFGTFLSVAFYCVNKGSKFWQENWENQVAILSPIVLGPLFKAVLRRPDKCTPLYKKILYGPAPISVSQVNQWISLCLICVWVGLMCFASPARDHIPFVMANHPFLTIGFLTLCACLIVRLCSPTSFGPHKPFEVPVLTSISEPE
jgi:hypothetical protein